MFATRAVAHDGERLADADDSDALVRLEVTQALVAGDDEIGACRERAGEDGVVVRVGKHGRLDSGRGNAAREARVAACQALGAHVRGGEALGELGARQDLDKLRQELGARVEQDAARAGGFQQLARRALPQQR